MAWKAGAYRVRLARTLGELPASLDSARAGRASLRQRDPDRPARQRGRCGAGGAARAHPGGRGGTLDLTDMRTLIQAARLRIDPDGVLADDNRAHERRWFECEQSYGGEWFLRGQLDAESARW